jgi:adenosylcobinamide-GDP ribazoletransferase
MLKEIMRFLITLQLLTRIPISYQFNVQKEDYSEGITYFPLIGLILGSINLIVYNILKLCHVENGFLMAVLLMFTNLVLTGGIHLDGLADTCDGIFSNRSKERILEIMRDSHIGTFGVVAILMDLLLRTALLYELSFKQINLAILLMPLVGRTVYPLLMFKATYARKEGLGDLYIGKLTNKRFIITQIIGLAIIFYLLPLKGLYLTLLSALIAIIYRRYIVRKIDGLTGDTLGAGLELIEICFLLFFFILN